ncbi:putative metal chaperone, involved in Zn homeostasis, GTPase of COG0523 family [Lachnospiraceae bacterium TWA4]|nr:putative metal chaperone, involved in Zn homeostasis, GTPase of COG0523 family [Lachnospiraceae bacterium TWA4]
MPILIENDYGSLGIDSVVMEETGVRVEEMTSGCICCSLIGNFVLALEKLIKTQNPEHIIIEPSGVGKLSEILEGLNDLTVEFEKGLVLTIVDAKRFDYNDQYVSEYFWDQISHADGVVLSKTQKLSGKQISDLCDKIHAKVHKVEVICLPLEAAYHPVLDELQEHKQKSIPKHMRPTFTRVKKARGNGTVFESWSVEPDRDFNDRQLQEIIDALSDKKTYGAIVRAKGILNHEGGQILLDYVPDEGSIQQLSKIEESRFFVIGMNLNRPELEKLFK